MSGNVPREMEDTGLACEPLGESQYPPPKQSDGASDASATTPVEKQHGIATPIIMYMSAGDSADIFTHLACPLCRPVKSVGSFALCNRYSTHMVPKCKVVCSILAGL